MSQIPSIERKEWKNLLSGDLDVSLKNFFFQMKVTQAKNQISNGSLSIEKAISDIHTLCTKFSKAKNMDEDMEMVFGKSKEETPVEIIKEKAPAATPEVVSNEIKKTTKTVTKVNPTSDQTSERLAVISEKLGKFGESVFKKLVSLGDSINSNSKEILELKNKNKELTDKLSRIEGLINDGFLKEN